MRRPRRVALAFALVPRRQLEQRFERARRARRSPRDDRPSPRIAPAWSHREVRGLAVLDLVPVKRRRHARVGRGPHRVRGGDGAVLGVLVVVEEDAVALLLPPFAGGERGRAPLDLARQRQRRAPHLVERPARLDPHVYVHAARARRLRPAASPKSVERRLARPRATSRTCAHSRRARDRGRRAARRGDRGPRRAPDAGAAPGTPGSPSRPAPRRRAARPLLRCGPTGTGAPPPRSRPDATPARASGRRTRRRCRWDSAPARWAGRPRRAARPRRPRGSSARGRAWCTPASERAPCAGSRSRPRGRRRQDRLGLAPVPLRRGARRARELGFLIRHRLRGQEAHAVP